jgi:hypothetical protein
LSLEQALLAIASGFAAAGALIVSLIVGVLFGADIFAGGGITKAYATGMEQTRDSCAGKQ